MRSAQEGAVPPWDYFSKGVSMLKHGKAVRVLAVALAISGGLVSQLAVVTDAHAKRAKCFATPVPGQHGVSIVTCTTRRP
jgi:hypothetical protein